MDKAITKVLAFQIDKTNKTLRQYSQKEFDRLGIDITVDQWVLLKIIEEHKELSQKELAEFSVRNAASITRTLDLLEKKNLIVREKSPHSRRQFTISLTEKGKDYIPKIMPVIYSHREKSTTGFSKNELELFNSFLSRVQENMN